MLQVRTLRPFEKQWSHPRLLLMVMEVAVECISNYVLETCHSVW
jgi:hypothetical protein